MARPSTLVHGMVHTVPERCRAVQMTSEQKGLLMFCRCRAKKTSILQATGFSLETVLSNRCGQGELRLTEALQ